MTPIPILLYHSVVADASPQYRPYAIAPDVFAHHLVTLRRLGCTPIRLRDVVDPATALPDRPVVITFDDGLADFLDGALPILRAYDVPATLFVVAGLVGGRASWLEPLGEGARRLLSAEELRAVSDAGVEIGAHGMTHRELDVLPPDAAREEIERSKAILERLVGTDVDAFSYPHGYFDSTVRALVAEAGYSFAVAAKNRSSSRRDDRFALARVSIDGETALERLAAVLNGGTPIADGHELVRTRVWRTVRRSRARRLLRGAR